jgi:hypothetical protein
MVAGLFRLVARGPADAAGTGEPGVHQVHDQPLVGVLEVVAVIHPDTGVVGDEGDVVALPCSTLSESNYQGLPVAGVPLRDSTTVW